MGAVRKPAQQMLPQPFLVFLRVRVCLHIGGGPREGSIAAEAEVVAGGSWGRRMFCACCRQVWPSPSWPPLQPCSNCCIHRPCRPAPHPLRPCRPLHPPNPHFIHPHTRTRAPPPTHTCTHTTLACCSVASCAGTPPRGRQDGERGAAGRHPQPGGHGASHNCRRSGSKRRRRQRQRQWQRQRDRRRAAAAGAVGDQQQRPRRGAARVDAEADGAAGGVGRVQARVAEVRCM